MIKAIIYEDGTEKENLSVQEIDYSAAIQRLKARMIDRGNFMKDENPWKVDYQKFSQIASVIQERNDTGVPPLNTKSRCKERAIRSLLETVLSLENDDPKTALEIMKEGLMYLCLVERKPL